MIVCSKFNDYLAVNRWVYDRSRGIPIDSQRPQQSKDMDLIPLEPLLETPLDDTDGLSVGSRVTDGSNVRSSRLMEQRARADEAKREKEAAEEREKEAAEKLKELVDITKDSEDNNPTAPDVRSPSNKASTAISLHVWTEKQRKALRTAVKKHMGKAHNKGTCRKLFAPLFTSSTYLYNYLFPNFVNRYCLGLGDERHEAAQESHTRGVEADQTLAR